MRKRYKLIPARNRRLRLILCLSSAAMLLGLLQTCTGPVLWRANRLGRRCYPAEVAERNVTVGGGGLKVVIVSFSEERRRGGSRRRSFKGLMEMVRENKKDYARRRGYDFVEASAGVIDRQRPSSWSKIRALKSQLPYYDWVFWNDADTLVMNSRISLEMILQAATGGTANFKRSPDLILTKDVTGVNAGVIFVRRSKWSMKFLDTWWNQTEFIRFGSSKSGDNDALQHLISHMSSKDMEKHIRISSMQCLFNSYPWIPTWKNSFRLLTSPKTTWKGTYSEGDFMVHLAGLDEKAKWAAKILQDQMKGD